VKILIIGGTRLLGRHIVESALGRGYEITLFNRGITNPDIFTDIETIHGDRDGGLGPLKGRKWDTVIDTSGYFPRVVSQAVDLLRESTDTYVFLSTVAVYDDLSQLGLKENAPLATTDDPTFEEIVGESYGALKALCEKSVRKAFKKRALIIRSGLLVGPYDPSDRFSYWVNRIARGGRVLAARPKNFQVQFIDARDLAGWILDMAAGKKSGTYNAIGPGQKTTMEIFLKEINNILGNKAKLVWVNKRFILDNGVKHWTDLPIWIADKKEVGMLAVDNAKALKAGLTFRPFDKTVIDTLKWLKTRPKGYRWKNGLSIKREKELIKKWGRR
jgi:2'-hydroxyisoflavone reductase